MGNKSDLSYFERGMVVGARRAGLSISQSAQFQDFQVDLPVVGFRLGR